MKFIQCFIIFILIHFTLIAQRSFEPGYIVKQNQDTVRGFVEVAINRDLTHSVKFKKEESAELKEYNPADLLAFAIGNDLYLSKHFLNTAQDSVMETAFVKQLVKGEYSLYSYSKDELVYYLLQKDTTVYFLFDRVTDNLGEIKQEGNYLNYLNLISINCEKLNKNYAGMGYNDKNLADFVLKADNCSSDEKAVSYYQKPKSVKQYFGFVGGFPPSLTQFSANFTLQFSLPRIYKNIFFNVGLSYSYTTKKSSALGGANETINYTNNYNIVSIPFAIQWNFTTSRLQPYFYAGLSASIYNVTSSYGNFGKPYTPQPFVVAMVTGLGIQMKIGSRFYIRAEEVCNINGQYEMEFQNPAIGIAYRF
ncbi:MAG TPA: hypothetical protein VNW49_08510 [Puia sp.]|nr:hypothetical protein [Puia sp.]